MDIKIVPLLAALALTGTACTHAMVVRNIGEFTKTVAAPQKVTMALVDGSDSSEQHEYFSFVHTALATHPSIEKVVLLAWNETPQEPVDVVVRVRPKAQYDGSNWNYLITFPGFLLFTHAWNGFLYSADLTTAVDVKLPADDDWATTEFKTRYDLRYCDFDRGAATSSGWYTPGWGGLNLIIGFVMVSYDPDGTPKFQQEVRDAYGRYIANSIVEMSTERLVGQLPVQTSRAACKQFDPAAGEFRDGCSRPS